jgi:hypothetical protein
VDTATAWGQKCWWTGRIEGFQQEIHWMAILPRGTGRRECDCRRSQAKRKGKHAIIAEVKHPNFEPLPVFFYEDAAATGELSLPAVAPLDLKFSVGPAA